MAESTGEPWVDPDTAALLASMAVDFAEAPAAPSVEDRRLGLSLAARLYGPAPQPVGRVEEGVCRGPSGQVPLRIYWPLEESREVPLLVNIHGGGWALGGPEAYERIARAYCAAGNCIVVDVDYRRAPEHKHPAALQDCLSALSWVHDKASLLGADPSRIILTGDSAGGHLAALAALQTDIPLAGQILVYPVTTVHPAEPPASRKRLGDGRYFLREADIYRAEAEYFADPAQQESRSASPLLCDKADLAKLPPTLVITASLDPLLDEGAAYAKRLEDAGVDVEYVCATGTIHGFVLFAGQIAQGREVIRAIGRRIGSARAKPDIEVTNDNALGYG
jgi:acetyl esterase